MQRYLTARDADRAADRAAFRALVEEFPRCRVEDCDGAGLWSTGGEAFSWEGAGCDDHRSEGESELPYAAAVRAVLKRMEGW